MHYFLRQTLLTSHLSVHETRRGQLRKPCWKKSRKNKVQRLKVCETYWPAARQVARARLTLSKRKKNWKKCFKCHHSFWSVLVRVSPSLMSKVFASALLTWGNDLPGVRRSTRHLPFLCPLCLSPYKALTCFLHTELCSRYRVLLTVLRDLFSSPQ